MKNLGFVLVFFSFSSFASNKDCEGLFDPSSSMDVDSHTAFSMQKHIKDLILKNQKNIIDRTKEIGPTAPLSHLNLNNFENRIKEQRFLIFLHGQGTQEHIKPSVDPETQSMIQFLISLPPRPEISDELHTAATEYLMATKTKVASDLTPEEKRKKQNQLVQKFLSINPNNKNPNDLKSLMEKVSPYILADIVLQNEPHEEVSFVDPLDVSVRLPQNSSLMIQEHKLEDFVKKNNSLSAAKPQVLRLDISALGRAGPHFHNSLRLLTKYLEKIPHKLLIALADHLSDIFFLDFDKNLHLLETFLQSLLDQHLLIENDSLHYFSYDPENQILSFIYSNIRKKNDQPGDLVGTSDLVIHYAQINFQNSSYFHKSHTMNIPGLNLLDISADKNKITSIIELTVSWVEALSPNNLFARIYYAHMLNRQKRSLYILPRNIREVLTVK